MADDYDDLSRKGAAFVEAHLRQKPESLLCAASGSSPLGLYRNLAAAHARDGGPFSRLRVIKLDEWGPLSATDPGSCEHYVQEEIVKPLGITPDRYFTLAGDAPDPEAKCKAFSSVLEDVGPIDISVLGLGVNGHLGMNEPGPWLHETAHVAALAKESRGHTMLAAADTKPEYGLTLGMGEILRSRAVLLLVSGAKKQDAMHRLLSREITTQFPASLLWIHGNATIICDREAYPLE